MFGLNLNSFLVAGVAGFMLASVATATFYEKVIVPGRESAVETRVTADVEERIAAATKLAAAEAVAGELSRRAAAISAAIAAHQRAVAADAAEQAAKLEELEEENKRYAETLAANGRSCPLGRDDLDYLDGVRSLR